MTPELSIGPASTAAPAAVLPATSARAAALMITNLFIFMLAFERAGVVGVCIFIPLSDVTRCCMCSSMCRVGMVVAVRGVVVLL